MDAPVDTRDEWQLEKDGGQSHTQGVGWADEFGQTFYV